VTDETANGAVGADVDVEFAVDCADGSSGAGSLGAAVRLPQAILSLPCIGDLMLFISFDNTASNLCEREAMQ
jgi:hypothetical protein